MRPRVFRHRLQYASNFQISGMIKIHPREYIKPVEGADLALLGNIGRPNPELANFFKWCEFEFQNIYWVPGVLELSSTEDDTQDMMRRPEILREWLQKNHISRVNVMTKNTKDIHVPALRLLGTPLIGSDLDFHSKKLYKWQDGKLQPLTAAAGKRLQKEETEWLLRNIQRSTCPCVCLTTNEISMQPNRIFNPNTVLGQLFGQTSDGALTSFTGKENDLDPWTGVNIFGHKNYNPSAFLEISHKESEADAMEHNILEQLYNLPEPMLRGFRPTNRGGPHMM